MKLHFEPDLDFQLQAIEAVCDLFRGQEVCRSEFTVTPGPSEARGRLFAENHLGIGNRLTLLDEEILSNLKEVQVRNGVPPSDSLASGDFTVEMETGTGKTYVYLRTIFELNKRYGFTKFVIVVPSVAIKEGVYKSLQITEDHFRALYSGTPFDYFLYDSAKLGQVRNFASSPQIQIMVVTVGAINKKDVNNLYKDSEKTGGEKPIDLICATRPVVIVDEPQSVDGGLRGQGRKALGGDESALHPALLGDARRPAPHGLPARCRGRLPAQAREADRGGVGHDPGRTQQALRAAALHEQSSWRDQRPGRNRRGVGGRRSSPGEDRHGRRRPRADHGPCCLRGLPHRRDPCGARERVPRTPRAGQRTLPAAGTSRGETWTPPPLRAR